MFVHTSVLPDIAAEYLTSVVLPKLPTPLLQFGVGFALPFVSGRVREMVAANQAALRSWGLIDDNGKVDLDKAKCAAYEGLERCGGTLPIMGYAADRSDVDALFEIAKRHSTTGVM